MQITALLADRLVNTFADALSGGRLVVYAGNSPEPLALQPFDSPAFPPAVYGVAVTEELAPSFILKTGEARLAELQTASGDVLALVAVRRFDDPKAEAGDVLVDRTDFHQGGLLTLARVTLTLPFQL